MASAATGSEACATTSGGSYDTIPQRSPSTHPLSSNPIVYGLAEWTHEYMRARSLRWLCIPSIAVNRLQHRSSGRGSDCEMRAIVCIVFEKVEAIVLEAATLKQ